MVRPAESYVILGNLAPRVDLNGTSKGINITTMHCWQGSGSEVALLNPDLLRLSDDGTTPTVPHCYDYQPAGWNQ